jgi:hypothetical protein
LDFFDALHIPLFFGLEKGFLGGKVAKTAKYRKTFEKVVKFRKTCDKALQNV